ncbi:MAG: winged helix-turn-helix domain-containing protein [Lysobacterales bacterium]|jgi:TolB-like protein/DNA-binding winged helix-turn-helix (wHTH) protein/Flp pilus assembly protein TadD
MTKIGQDRGSIALSRFTLKLDRAELLDAGEVVPLRPKSFDVLCYLAERRGVLVSTQELLDAVWGETVVTEDSVRQCITDIRKALHDDDHSVLSTVPRRGYILDPADAEDEEGIRETANVATPRRKTAWLIGAALVVVIAIVAGIRIFGGDAVRHEGADAAPAPRNSIAVLRFADMSPAGDHAYLAEGIAEEILHRLAQSPSLRVIARTSSFALEGEAIASIARQLNVAHVLEGSVRRDGDRIRVTVQLIDAATSTHRWSETYNAEFADILELESGIANAVAGILDATLGTDIPAETPDPQAHDHLLLGRFLYFRRAAGDIERAEALFEQALTIDPSYAQAWVNLAAVANVRLHGAAIRGADLARRAELLATQKYAVEQALHYAPRLVEAQMRAAAYFWNSGDQNRALEHIATAQELDSNHWLVLSAKAAGLVSSVQIDDAVRVLREILKDDPLNPVTRGNLGVYLFYAGRFEDALAEFERASRLHGPTGWDPSVAGHVAQTLLLLGRHDEALELVLSLPEGPARDQGLALAHFALGATPDADRELAGLVSRADGAADMLAVAEVYAYRGNAGEALAWLDRLAPLLACWGEWGEVRPRQAYYSPFIARISVNAAIEAWRTEAARRMAECRY